ATSHWAWILRRARPRRWRASCGASRSATARSSAMRTSRSNNRRAPGMNRFTAAFALFLIAGSAWAQAYPNRAVRIIVPWPPGQATDIAARVVAEKLSQQLGQPFVADNRPGAGGSIGTDAVAKAAGDGYTLLAASSGPISIMPNLQKVPYDPLKDLQPVSLIAMRSEERRVG